SGGYERIWWTGSFEISGGAEAGAEGRRNSRSGDGCGGQSGRHLCASGKIPRRWQSSGDYRLRYRGRRGGDRRKRKEVQEGRRSLLLFVGNARRRLRRIRGRERIRDRAQAEEHQLSRSSCGSVGRNDGVASAD